MSNFFNEEKNPSTEEEDTHYKSPEFVLIDPRQDKTQYTYFDSNAQRQSSEEINQEDVKKNSSNQGPLSLRFICVLGLIFCLLFGLGIFIWSTVLTILSVATFFQNQAVNQTLKGMWKMCLHTTVAIFGFTLGLLSPTLGIGLIALYLSVAGNVLNDGILRKILRRSFNQF